MKDQFGDEEIFDTGPIFGGYGIKCRFDGSEERYFSTIYHAVRNDPKYKEMTTSGSTIQESVSKSTKNINKLLTAVENIK